jgi:hypothetical protein
MVVVGIPTYGSVCPTGPILALDLPGFKWISGETAK